MNAFDVIQTTLATAVAAAGTFTVAYPAKRTIGTYQLGVDHRISWNGLQLKFPTDFTVSFGATVATVTLVGVSLPAGASIYVQLNHTGGPSASMVEQLEIISAKAENAAVDISAGSLVICELGSPAVGDLVGVAALQTLAAGGAMTLTATPVVADVPRAVQFRNTGTHDLTGTTLDVTGLDVYGVAVSEGLVGTSGAGTTAGKKAFASVSSAVLSGGTLSAGSGINVGFSNVLGLPVMLKKAGLVIKELQDGVAPTAGTVTAADQASPALTTGDIRGTYTPNATPDGTKSFALVIALPHAETGPVQFTG